MEKNAKLKQPAVPVAELTACIGVSDGTKEHDSGSVSVGQQIATPNTEQTARDAHISSD